MKKRALSLLMSLVMLVSMLPTTAWAADETETTRPTTVNVDFTAQAAGAFLIAPQFNVEVASNEAERFGYTDSVEGVSALDVLVKAHEIILGEDADSIKTSLEVNDYGYITTIFGEKTGSCGFTINGEQPHDDVLVDYSQAPGGKTYTGYTITKAAVKNSDVLEFYIYQDSAALDYYPLYKQNGKNCAELSVKPGSDVTLTLDGYHIGYYGCVPMQALEEYEQIEAIEDAQFAWVTADEDAAVVTDIPDAVSDENGAVTFSAPETEGVYYLTAYMPADEIEDNYATPIIMHLLKVTAVPFSVTASSTALTEIDYGAKGYSYYDYTDNAMKNVPLYTITVPKGTDVVAFDFGAAAYDLYYYDRNGNYIDTAAKDSVKTDANGDSVFDYVQVQNPYTYDEQGNWTGGGELKYAVAFRTAEGINTFALSESSAALTQYKTLTLSPVVDPVGAYDITWTSSNEAAASVANGVITGKSAGNAVITATLTDQYGTVKTASCDITVTVPKVIDADTVRDNIAASYAASGVANDQNAPWLAADMMAYEKTFPKTANQLSAEHKQAMVDTAVDMIESSSAPGDLAKSIIALVSMGYDPAQLTTSSKADLNGVKKLIDQIDADNAAVTNVYTLPYVLIALQQFGDAYQTQINKLVTAAVASTSSWVYTYYGTDATAPMVLALAPYYSSNSDVKAAIDAAIVNVKAVQSESGAVGNAASTGLVMAAFAALGETPDSIKNSNTQRSLVDGLMLYVNEGQNAFEPTSNSFSTEQGFRGLIALANAKEGQPYRLYNFSGQNLVPAVATQAGVNFAVIPNDAKVVVTDSENHEVAAVSAYRYDLPAGDYTYTVSKDGYVTKTGSFTITAEQVAGHEKQTIHVSLVSAGSGSGSSSKDIKVTVKVMVPPADQSKRYTYKHDSRSYTNLLTTTGKVTVTAGSSVRDAFVTALDRDKIGYTEQSNGYFPTIGSWSEFERGEKSGWMYLVNGSMPSVAAQDYELTGNATVVWFYTDDYSNDYGSESWDDDSSSSGTTTTPTTPTTPANPVPDKAMSFTDVKSNDWYYSSVRYAYDNGLFSGVSHDSFGPGDSMDRSMLATVLYSLDGKPAAGKSGFADVADGAWYADAVAWAAEHGIVSGVGGGAFTPGGTITREQLAVMLYRYAQYKGYDVSKTADLSGYADQDKLSDWAAQAVQWACGSGLMNGRSAAQLAPEGTLTRAEAATMLKAFCENVKK